MKNFKKCSFKKLQERKTLEKSQLKKQQAEEAEVVNIQAITAIIEDVTKEILKNRDTATQKSIRAAYIDASIEINEQENFTGLELFFAAGFISASESLIVDFILQENQDEQACW